MNNSSPSLLIIDDDPLCHFIGKRIAMAFREDMKVLNFTSPVEALKFIENAGNIDVLTKPIAVFLDINMPEMNGWELLARLDIQDEKKR
ncbi:response regulator [uncultured Imperialibacter sp.]|uniref:response regulator n=1 Tax=uncultured Imperialibacter sp. TaxID=1672639 RepID=UPI0030DB50E2|tara:strand:- start:22985 stop:23251 length:267 start_codon:yes stop_codon:yes gene_type:complete